MPPSKHHDHELLRLCTSMGRQASIMSISCSGFARAWATKQASCASAVPALHEHGPPSKHHEHKLFRLCTSMGHQASIMRISCSGFARAWATQQASCASAAQALHEHWPPSKHHEHQLLKLCTSMGHQGSIMNIIGHQASIMNISCSGFA